MTPTLTPTTADRIALISVSSTMKVMADADKLRREGVDVVDFGAGEPDFPTPDNIKKAAIAAIDANFTKYTNTGGTPEIKQRLGVVIEPRAYSSTGHETMVGARVEAQFPHDRYKIRNHRRSRNPANSAECRDRAMPVGGRAARRRGLLRAPAKPRVP